MRLKSPARAAVAKTSMAAPFLLSSLFSFILFRHSAPPIQTSLKCFAKFATITTFSALTFLPSQTHHVTPTGSIVETREPYLLAFLDLSDLLPLQASSKVSARFLRKFPLIPSQNCTFGWNFYWQLGLHFRKLGDCARRTGLRLPFSTVCFKAEQSKHAIRKLVAEQCKGTADAPSSKTERQFLSLAEAVDLSHTSSPISVFQCSNPDILEITTR